MYVCGMPEGALEEPKIYDFHSSEYWRAVENSWAREIENRRKGHFCWPHLDYCSPAKCPYVKPGWEAI